MGPDLFIDSGQKNDKICGIISSYPVAYMTATDAYSSTLLLLVCSMTLTARKNN